jgi:membrane-bound metal-dependent hydrolase YbcI (DUF457 family)
MTWRTHVAIGANAIWLTGLLGKVDESILVLLPTAIIASLLPDIDATAAKIHYAAGGALGIFKGAFYGKYFHHRGLMHSFFVAIILFFILVIAFNGSYPLLAPIFFLSYISHSIIDGLNTTVGYFYPFIYKRFALLPRWLRFPVGSPVDILFMFGGIAGLLLFFAAFYTQLIPANPKYY